MESSSRLNKTKKIVVLSLSKLLTATSCLTYTISSSLVQPQCIMECYTSAFVRRQYLRCHAHYIKVDSVNKCS